MRWSTVISAAALVIAAHPVRAQDPVKLSPNLYTVLLDNERVRVLDFHVKPGQKEPMHAHPASVVYVLTDGRARFTTPDGKSEVRDTKAGQTLWSDPTTHSYEYLGPGDGHVLIIELKGSAKPAADSKRKP